MKNFDAIILAGGLGTRLSAVSGDLPKALMPVNGRPFIEILFKLLNKSGCIDTVVIAAGHKGDRIISEYEKNTDYGFKILFSMEEKLLGTGGAIKKNLSLTASDDVLIMNGDSYADIDIRDFYNDHKKQNALITIALAKVENANRYGKINISNDRKILSFEEKVTIPSGGYINAGMYLFDRKLFDHVPNGTVVSLERDLLPDMIKSQAYGYLCRGKFIDIGTPETAGLASEYLKE